MMLDAKRPTFFPSLGVTHDDAATLAGSLLLAAPAHVGEAFAFAAGHGGVACGVACSAVRHDKAVLRRVREGPAFISYLHIISLNLISFFRKFRVFHGVSVSHPVGRNILIHILKVSSTCWLTYPAAAIQRTL